MNTLRTLGTVTTLALAAALSAQAPAAQGAAEAQAPPSPVTSPPVTSPDPSTASSPHQRDVTGHAEDTAEAAPGEQNVDPNVANPADEAGANERAAGKEKEMTGDTKPKDKLVGLPVESSDGAQLGSVVDIVRDTNGKPMYAIVAIDNDTTAVPYDVAVSMIRAGKVVVMNPQRLAGAPRVKQSEWLDQQTSKWRTESDRYWGNTRTAQPADAPMPKER